MSNGIDFKRMCVELKDKLIESEALNHQLLDVLESVAREHELLRWMKNLEHQRGKGSFGIAVAGDEIALEWQSHRKNLDRLVDARTALMEKAKGNQP